MQFIPIGRLPGDIVIKKGSITFYFPIVTSFILIIVLHFIFYFIGNQVKMLYILVHRMRHQVKVDLFDFHLPEELIAQTPLDDSASSRTYGIT